MKMYLRMHEESVIQFENTVRSYLAIAADGTEYVYHVALDEPMAVSHQRAKNALYSKMRKDDKEPGPNQLLTGLQIPETDKRFYRYLMV